MSERLSDSMRDRIARVIFESDFPHMDWTDESESYRDEWRKNADALLAAFPWLADEPTERIAALQAEVERQTAYAKNAADQQGHLMRQHREARARAEAAEAKLAAVREYIAAVQNSPGLTETGHHERWLREALTVIDGVDTGTGSA